MGNQKNKILQNQHLPMKTYKVQGQWRGKSAGGCVNFSSWRFNPQLYISVKEKKKVKITLTQAKPEDGEEFFFIGFYVAVTSSKNTLRRQLILTRDNLKGK